MISTLRKLSIFSLTGFCLLAYFLGFAQASSREEYFRQRMENLKKIKRTVAKLPSRENGPKTSTRASEQNSKNTPRRDSVGKSEGISQQPQQGQQYPQGLKKRLLETNKELEKLVQEYQNIASFAYKESAEESAERKQRLNLIKEKIRLLLKKEVQIGSIPDSQQEIILEDLLRKPEFKDSEENTKKLGPFYLDVPLL